MRLDQIPSGSEVFIDANIFIYHFTGVSDECSQFLGRCERGEILGTTGVTVLLEALHRLMMVEAAAKGLVEPPNLVNKLKRHPPKVKQLHEYYTHTQKIEKMGIQIKTVTPLTITKSQFFRMRYGLMVNDSIILTIMEEAGIPYLATRDDGFSGVEEITVAGPEDIDI
jgi:predicted nucleic acid-binding protein